MEKVAVIGLGRFGTTVVEELVRLGHDVLGIDQDEHIVNSIVGSATHALILDSSNKDALIKAGLKTFNIVVVGIGENIEASILTTLILKELGVKNVISRAISKYHGVILEKIGADRIVYPESEIGKKVARSIVIPDLIDFIELGSELSIAEMLVSKNMVGKSLVDLQLRNKYNVNIVAIKRGDQINSSPGPDDVLLEGDSYLVSGHPQNISRLKDA